LDVTEAAVRNQLACAREKVKQRIHKIIGISVLTGGPTVPAFKEVCRGKSLLHGLYYCGRRTF
jgi:hypothetical protein